MEDPPEETGTDVSETLLAVGRRDVDERRVVVGVEEGVRVVKDPTTPGTPVFWTILLPVVLLSVASALVSTKLKVVSGR